jgi:Tetracyclin repressor-like, C-terminal domain
MRSCGYGLAEPAATDAVRLLRSTFHGFAALEASGGFGHPRDVGESWRQAVRALHAALAQWPAERAPAPEPQGPAAGRGGTGDRDAYARNHVVARLRRNAGAIRRNDLAIMLKCGDNDCFNLHDGTEYLHRALRDLDVSHDYHLIRGADHVGPGELSDMGPLFQSLAHPPLGPTLPTPSPPARVTRPRCPVGRRPGDRRFRRECRRAPQAWHYR